MRKSLTFFGFAILVLTTFVLIEGLAMHLAHEHKHISVDGPLPEGFPVIVSDATGATVVRAGGLGAFLQTHPGSTFLLADERLPEFRDSLSRQAARSRADRGRLEPDLHFVYCSFAIESTLAGRQRIRVSAAGDEDWENESVYEATQSELHPISHTKYFGPGMVILTSPISALVTATLWLPAFVMLYRRRSSVAPAAN